MFAYTRCTISCFQKETRHGAARTLLHLVKNYQHNCSIEFTNIPYYCYILASRYMVGFRLQQLLLFFSCILVCLSSAAQTSVPGYSVVNYNSDNALPQNSINDMVFDQSGFLWLTTEMGVLRFDGQHFREYNMANTPALYSNRCALISSVKGKIVVEPDFASHHFLTVTDNYQIKEDSALSANPYQCNRWNNCLFSYAALFKKWGGDSTTFKGLLHRLELNGDMVTENEKHAYVKNDSSCYYLDDNTVAVHLLADISGHAMKIQFMVDGIFFYVDRQNNVYAYKSGHLQKAITCSPRLMQIFGQAESGAYPMQYTVNAIRDTSHTFLVYKDNILLLEIRNDVLDFQELASNTSIRNIKCLVYDDTLQDLYIGTATNGLYILKKQPFRRLFFTSDHYAINCLYAQVELPDGRILTSSGLLSRNGVNKPLPGVYDRPAMLKSSDGYIWYSNFNSLKRIDIGLHTPVTLQYLDCWLCSIIETANKEIFYCGFHKLYRRKGATDTTLLDFPKLMNNAIMLVIQQVSPDNLWIGTTSGLFSYNMVNGALRSMPEFEKVSVRAIHKAGDGIIWIGTYGQGFYRYEGGRFLKMPMDAGNNLSSVHCFMEDKQGYFWMPTNKGLYRVAKKELDSYASGNKENVFFYYFDKSSGYTSNEFNGGCTPAGIVTHDGYFSLPSMDGLVQFNPDSISVDLPSHPVIIERIIADGKNVLPAEQFEHRQDAGPLVFGVASPYFGDAANLHLEYAIPQLDDKWRPVSRDGKLVLTGLHKGRYTLFVRKQDRYGKYTKSQVTWTVLPYWYETTWFRLLMAFAVVSIFFIVFWLLYARELKRAELLEQKVAERTEALFASTQVKEKMIGIILHDLRSPHHYLYLLATRMYEQFKKASRDELAHMLFAFRKATYDLNEFTQDFLVWTNSQKDGFVVRPEIIALHGMVEGIVSMYEPAAAVQKNIVRNEVAATVSLVSDANILKLIIRNLIDNANKYTANGEIKIEATQDTATVCIIISDSGKAMSDELVASIVNNTYEGDNNKRGFGYKIILELLIKIQGSLVIDHPGDNGNRITLTFANTIG